MRFLLLALIFFTACQPLAGRSPDLGSSPEDSEQTAERSTCPPGPNECPNHVLFSDWSGKSINLMIANWGRPTRISVSEDYPGYFDYTFTYYLNPPRPNMFINTFPPHGSALWPHPYPGPFGFAPFGYYNYAPPYTCTAEVRVQSDGQIACVSVTDSFRCFNRAVFRPAPVD
jgi:hypothetical protein